MCGCLGFLLSSHPLIWETTRLFSGHLSLSPIPCVKSGVDGILRGTNITKRILVIDSVQLIPLELSVVSVVHVCQLSMILLFRSPWFLRFNFAISSVLLMIAFSLSDSLAIPNTDLKSKYQKTRTMTVLFHLEPSSSIYLPAVGHSCGCTNQTRMWSLLSFSLAILLMLLLLIAASIKKSNLISHEALLNMGVRYIIALSWGLSTWCNSAIKGKMLHMLWVVSH